jgi:glutamate 5-kinase
MGTKLEAAGIATAAGVATLLTSADRAREGLAGEDVGTMFTPTGSRRASRLLWLAHATEPRGRVLVDAGAVRAVVDRRKSLLPAGITAVEGRFDEGDPIDVCNPEGEAVARGLVNYSSDELPGMLGRSTHDLARDLGPQYEREVIHRDAMVLLGP